MVFCGFRRLPQHKRATIRGAARWRERPTRPLEAHGLGIPAAAAAVAAAADSSGHDPWDDTEKGEDWLGNHNWAEYRAVWHRGETDTTPGVGSAAMVKEGQGMSSATGHNAAVGDASVRTAAAGDVVVQVRDFLQWLSSSAYLSRSLSDPTPRWCLS